MHTDSREKTGLALFHRGRPGLLMWSGMCTSIRSEMCVEIEGLEIDTTEVAASRLVVEFLRVS